MIRAVLFDLDRTLMDRDASMATFASSQFGKYRPQMEGVEPEAFVEAFIRADERGKVWKDVVYQRLVRELGLKVPWEELFEDFDRRINDHQVPFPHLHGVLEELSHAYQLGMITNGRTDFQNRTIDAMRIRHWFREILISETEGVRKPEPEIFRRALSRLGVEPHEAVYVGDHPIADMQGARDAGMRTLWKRNEDFADAECDAAFDDLLELPELVRAMDG